MLAEIQFECSHCGQKLAVESAHAGRDADCPNCQAHLIVPRLDGRRERVTPAGLSTGGAGVESSTAGLLDADVIPETAALREKFAEASGAIGRLQRDLAHALTASAKLRQQLAEITTERDSLASAGKLMQEEFERGSAERLALQEDLSLSRKRLSATEAQLSSREDELDQAVTELDSLKKEVEAAREMIDELARDGERLRSELETASQARDNFELESGIAQERVAALEAALKSTVETRDSLAAAREHLESENATLRSDLTASATGRELLELRERIKVAERERARAEKIAEQAEADHAKASQSERRQRTDVEALLRRCEAAERKLESFSEPQMHKDNEVLRGIVSRQKEELARQFTELRDHRGTRFGVRLVYLVLTFGAAGLLWLAVKALPQALHALKANGFL